MVGSMVPFTLLSPLSELVAAPLTEAEGVLLTELASLAGVLMPEAAWLWRTEVFPEMVFCPFAACAYENVVGVGTPMAGDPDVVVEDMIISGYTCYAVGDTFRI